MNIKKLLLRILVNIALWLGMVVAVIVVAILASHYLIPLSGNG
jgi:hypothetical protein